MSAKKERLWEAYLEEKGKAWLKVESGSMLPMIPVGANILIKRCDFKEIKPSDISWCLNQKGNLSSTGC